MKAVILAAGRGTRIQELTHGLPKCLLSFEDRNILDFQLGSLLQAGISKIAIVVGHAKEAIVDHVARHYLNKHAGITFVTNPEFACTNNIYSLWLTRDWLGGDAFFCLNADVLFHPGILLPALRTRADLSIIIDREFREETSKVTIRDGRVISLSKSISHYDFSGTFVNIANFSARGNRLIFATIDALLQEGQTHLVFNDALGRLSARGVAIRFTETHGLPWAEIDDANDLYYAQAVVYPALKRETVFCKVVAFPSKTKLPADPRPAA